MDEYFTGVSGLFQRSGHIFFGLNLVLFLVDERKSIDLNIKMAVIKQYERNESERYLKLLHDCIDDFKG